ncbi:MAG: OsmC family protein [Salinisphaeraceae bacterium]|nr:OsmC family protein [Salinisphaeraceae bacterium]
MKARIKWIENAAWLGETGSGHGIVIDGPDSIGGRNLGARPMELILLGVGSCSAMDVIHILKKSRQLVVDVDIEVSGKRAETDPKVFTDIHLHFKVAGEGLSEKQVARAVQLSAEKYCSASLMLQASVNITHGYEIVQAEG